ncbi:hypothetical protein SKTS_19490 [Sulfurimicrobium lacus]|uniref:Lipoprotein n=1 Tax=Sulfurimicrobium lacus TaxID=2715678 RepID=A0A6F8VB46_9PROT|nr:hypothetical protein [Sulfurimicrobium lacus]BCB27063.1 hypothetical protein SKTS_19490 [Sulfurimicrobium lacus]
MKSRKFILALLSMLSASILCATGHIADGVYSAVVIATVGAYMAANVTQKATAKPLENPA